MKNGKIEEALEQFLIPIIEKCVSEALEVNKDATVKEPERWLTVGKACKEFGCTVNTLRQAMIKLELPYYSLESRTYLKRIDVHRYLESLRIKRKDDVEEYAFLRQK